MTITSAAKYFGFVIVGFLLGMGYSLLSFDATIQQIETGRKLLLGDLNAFHFEKASEINRKLEAIDLLVELDANGKGIDTVVRMNIKDLQRDVDLLKAQVASHPDEKVKNSILLRIAEFQSRLQRYEFQYGK